MLVAVNPCHRTFYCVDDVSTYKFLEIWFYVMNRESRMLLFDFLVARVLSSLDWVILKIGVDIYRQSWRNCFAKKFDSISSGFLQAIIETVQPYHEIVRKLICIIVHINWSLTCCIDKLINRNRFRDWMERHSFTLSRSFG